ncbi:hypothetical protein PS659_05238 [Pseudomonas fluorescens]|uniref:Uncharacterized protein n=1 Tax=Pseudomonas fluorescens TaxID=294 RepID=A0A5E6XA51_PSEFL|nr:hypothetical protein PS659_05238 [Pseudomonas fluorescens]
MSPVNLGGGVNLSTNEENSAANMMLRVSDPVSEGKPQGPRH